MDGIERPLDLLNQSKGKEILVVLKNDKQLVGKLLAFDIHINIVLDNAREIVDNEIKRNLGLTIVVGRKKNSIAEYYVKNVGEVLRFLQRISVM